MTVNQQTLLKIQSLEQLYRSGYHSSTVDAAIDKLVGIEQAHLEQELARLVERLHKLEAQYQISSPEFYRLFQSGEMATKQTSLNGAPSTRCGSPRVNNWTC